MRALVAFQLRLVLRAGFAAAGAVVGIAVFVLLFRFLGETGGDPLGVAFYAGWLLLGDLLLCGYFMALASADLTIRLPVSPRAMQTARLLVLGGIWAILAVAIALLVTPGNLLPGLVNLFFAGAAAIALLDAAALATRNFGTVARVVLVGGTGGGAVGAFAGTVTAAPTGTFLPTPWLAAAAALVAWLAIAAAGRREAAPPARGRSGAERATVRTPRASILRVSLLHPLPVAWIVLLLLMSFAFPLAGNRGILGMLFILSMSPLLLQTSLQGYGGLFALPIPRARAFRLFFLPAFLFTAACLGIRFAASAVSAHVRTGPVDLLAEALVLLLFTTAVFRVQVAGGRQFGFVFGGILMILVTPLVFLPILGVTPVQDLVEGIRSAWLGILSAGGGLGRYAVAVLSAAATAALLASLRRSFERLEWTDLPEASLRGWGG